MAADSTGVFCKQRVTSDEACPVPSACQNRAETRDIEPQPDIEEICLDQENNRWPLSQNELLSN